MKNTTKYIVISLVILLVLGGAFAALYFTDPNRTAEPEESSAASGADISLYSRERADISSVDVKNAKGEFTILQTVTEQAPESTESSEASEGSESSSEPQLNYSYSFKGFEKYPSNSTELESALRNVSGLTASKELGQVEQLSDYGLEGEEAAQVTVNFKDGTKESFTAGIAGGETYGNYILYNGRVYIGYTSPVLQSGVYDYLEPFSYATTDVDPGDGFGAMTLLSKLKLTGTKFAEPVEIYYDDDKSEYRLTTPVNSSCNTTNIDAVALALKEVNAAAVIQANVKEEELKQYGLDMPMATAEFEINGEKHSISVSEKKVDGNRYLLADGDKTIVYTIPAEDVSAWAEAKATSLRSTYVFLPVIMNVDEFTVESDGMSYTVDLARTKNEEKSSDTQTVYDYTAKLNGKEIPYESVTKFYSSMISIAVLNNDRLEHTKESELSLSFKYYEGGEDKLAYYRANEDRLVGLLNGEYSATVRSTSLDDFREALKAFVEQENVE